MEHQLLPGTSGQGSNSSSNACIACRKVKMKCQIGPDVARCARCERKSLDCVFQQHRRGRKLGMRASTAAATTGGEQPRRSTAGTSRDLNTQTLPLVSEDFWPDGRRGLHPASLLSRQARDGGFSLQNVLRPGHPFNTRSVDAQSCPDSGDPVVAGLLNPAIAASLFAGFMADLNPFVSQLDPELHTADYVRAKSAFLFTASLMAAAKVLNPALYSSLREHAETLLLDVVRHGRKSVEVVQAILIMTYWKDPQDTRVFVNVGLAIRIALELGWHDLASSAREVRETRTAMDERDRRNIERTWLVLFVYDRSLAMQTGKPAMIEHDALIDSVEEWRQSSVSCPSDVLLCALVKLRLLTSGMPGTFHRSVKAGHDTPSLVRLMRTSVKQWSSRWKRFAEADKRHQFFIDFYGRHTLLMLCSGELYRALSSPSSAQDLNLEPIWLGCDAALDALRLVIEDANATLAYFVQDSVHVMIAYAAVVLIKLLLSVPKEIRDELEPTCLSILRSLLAVLNAQAAAPNSACSLQAVFICNLLDMLQEAPPARAKQTCSAETNAALPDANAARTLPTNCNGYSLGPGNGEGERMYSSQDSASEGLTTSDPLDLDFVDDETWAAVFATAGFSITEGTFLPDLATNQHDE